jgi:hypothetical protein
MQFDTLQLVANTKARSSKPISDIEFQSEKNQQKRERRDQKCLGRDTKKKSL